MSLSTPNSNEHQERAEPEYTNDTMFRGRVLLRQHRQGYRFSVDAVLLSSFAAACPPVETLDLGTGCGVIPLLLADLWTGRGDSPAMTALERQPALAALARYNIEQNNRTSQIRLICDDMRTWSQTETKQWKLITCNPPYQRPQRGRVSPHPERAAARHELYGTLEDIIRSGAAVLHSQGSLVLVYPAPLFPRLLQASLGCALHPIRVRWVHPRQNAPARLVLVQVTPISASLVVEPPLILYRSDSDKDYTDEANLILDGHS